MFQKNVGTLDRVVRVLVGLFIMWYGYDHQSWWGALGLVVLVTGALGTCWLYTLLGFSTCPVNTKSADPTSPANPVS